MGIISLRTLTDEEVLESSLATFAKVISAPTFPQEAIERRKKQAYVALQKQQESGQEIERASSRDRFL